MKNNSKQTSQQDGNLKNQSNNINNEQKQQLGKKLSESGSNKLLVNQTGQPKTPSKKSRRQSNDKSLLKTPKNSNQQEEEIPKYEQLCTGLRIFITEKLVHQMWQHDKPKQVLIEFLTNFVRYQGINKNFESIELNIIAEFHVFCLIFAKQELELDDYKTAIFLNLMWTLLINNNNDYGEIYKIYSLQCGTSSKQIESLQIPITNSVLPPQSSLQVQPKQQQAQQQLPISISMTKGMSMQLMNKTIQDDFQNFKIWIQRHSHHEPPKNIKIFSDHEVCKIIKYARDSYFTNFQLYNYCLSDKKKNEEIRLHVYIDIPLEVPPLSDALYMGKPKLDIEEDEYDDVEHDQNLLNQNSMTTYDEGSPMKFQNDNELGTQKQLLLQEQQQEDPIIQDVKKIVDEKIKIFSNTVQQSIISRDQEVENQLQEILNPKKKK